MSASAAMDLPKAALDEAIQFVRNSIERWRVFLRDGGENHIFDWSGKCTPAADHLVEHGTS
jgi:hypothetical protein